MSASGIDWVEGPYLVSRVNLFPYRPLRAPDPSVSADRVLLLALAEEERRRDGLRTRLVDELHRVAPGLETERHRREALSVKRDVFNDRPPRSSQPLSEGPLLERVPLLAAWSESWAATARAVERLDSAHADALVAERAVLAAWARDPSVDRSTALSSPDLHRAVAARAAADGPPDKRARKAEAALVRYFSRSTVKVSPYSLYTGVHFDDLEHPVSADRDGEPLRFSTRADLRRLLPRQAARVLAADPEARSGLEWVLTGSARREGQRLILRRKRWSPPVPGLRAEAFGEEEVRLPMTGVWGRLLGSLQARARVPVRLDGLREGLAEDLRCAPEYAMNLLDRLIREGILVPWAPSAEQSPHFARDWYDLAKRLPGTAAARVAAAFRSTEEVLDGFGAADGTERARGILRLQRSWSDALGEPGTATAPVVEDCLVSHGAPVPRSWTRAWSSDLRRLMPLLFALDDQRVLSGALESVFTARYGRGGRCADLDEFAEQARAAFPLTQRLMSDGAGETDPDGALSALLAARRRAVEYLTALTREDAESVEVDPGVVDEIAELLPEREFAAPRSFAVFGHPDRGRLVLNHVYGGRARYFSRFLADLPDDVRARVAAHVRRLAPEGSATVHMRSALGFNANLSPLLADGELALRDEPTLADGPSTRDLELVHTPNGLRLVLASTGQEIDPVYTGFLVPHALPYDEMLVAMVADSPFFSFGDLSLDLHDRRHEHGSAAGGRPSGGATPRISFGDVLLFRRRWAVDASSLRAEPGESAEALYRRVNTERLSRGIPDQVFARPLQGARLGPLERAMAPKPQHVDFLSRLHTATAAKRLAHLGPTLMVEEFLPSPEDGGLRGPDGRHATEVFLELSAVPRPPSPPMPDPPGEARLLP
ncbi:lantibiotic dehydratase [Nocardiopsis lucentensis]|uniref:lantibiotic dehydratase n=1 Tax=Nocardiopsis lucentensis TaxID=53441 RepID=UPI0003457CD0|nr:lantibiotic dehydratase [Nocardiopsis lucentensis]